MGTCNSILIPREEDYESFLSFLRNEPWPERKVHGIIEFHTPKLEDVPPEKPACEARCWSNEQGMFFQALGTRGTWELGDPEVKDHGEEYVLDSESIWHISRLCSIMKAPPVYTGISTLYGFLLFLRGMEETLPFRWGGYAVETLIDDTLASLVSDFGMSMDDRDLYMRLSTEFDDADHLKMWRVAFRECLLFSHPEIGLSYAAAMGNNNLFGFRTLLRRDWWWRGVDEGMNSFQLEHQTDDIFQHKMRSANPEQVNASRHAFDHESNAPADANSEGEI